MKLIIAIINHDDSQKVIRKLTKGGYSVTRLTTTGGFLMRGNTTLLIGVEENLVSGALDIIREESHSRTQFISPMGDPNIPDFVASIPTEVVVGGATVFVLDVEQFMKV